MPVTISIASTEESGTGGRTGFRSSKPCLACGESRAATTRAGGFQDWTPFSGTRSPRTNTLLGARATRDARQTILLDLGSIRTSECLGSRSLTASRVLTNAQPSAPKNRCACQESANCRRDANLAPHTLTPERFRLAELVRRGFFLILRVECGRVEGSSERIQDETRDDAAAAILGPGLLVTAIPRAAGVGLKTSPSRFGSSPQRKGG
jgi:hypothetical protein